MQLSFGPVSRQKITDTGTLTPWRCAAEPYTSEVDLHGFGMMQHDHDIGVVLDELKQNGLLNDTNIW